MFTFQDVAIEINVQIEMLLPRHDLIDVGKRISIVFRHDAGCYRYSQLD